MNILGLLIVLFAALPAFAELELRVHYGALTGKPGDLNSAIGNKVTSNPDMEGFSPMGLDLLYRAKTQPSIVGLRYETFETKKAGDVTYLSNAMKTENTMKGTRVALLAGYRFIAKPTGYVGVLGHYGLSQSLDYTESITYGPTTNNYSYTGSGVSSFGAGFEGGFNIQKLSIGAELGYVSWKGKLEDSNGSITTNNGTVDMNLSGPYWKLLVGFTFM